MSSTFSRNRIFHPFRLHIRARWHRPCRIFVARRSGVGMRCRLERTLGVLPRERDLSWGRLRDLIGNMSLDISVWLAAVICEFDADWAMRRLVQFDITPAEALTREVRRLGCSADYFPI